MKRTGRIYVVVLIGLICICLSASVILILGLSDGIGMLISEKPASARKVGSSIVDYTLPFGYLEQGSLNLAVFKVVYITVEGQDPKFDARTVMMLVQVPSALEFRQGNARQEIQLAMLRSSSEVSTMEYMGEELTEIRGEEVTLEVFETFGAYDTPTRMVFSDVFPGKSGNVMLVIAGPINTWDQSMVEQFMGSIK